MRERKKIRLTNRNYNISGIYLITLISKHRLKIFGEVTNNQINLSHFGHIAKESWQQIPLHFPQIKIDHFIIMPNHLHGIVWVNNSTQTWKITRDLHVRCANSIQTRISNQDIHVGCANSIQTRISNQNIHVGVADLRPLQKDPGLLPTSVGNWRPLQKDPESLPTFVGNWRTLQKNPGSLPMSIGNYRSKNSLSIAIHGFKSSVTKKINHFLNLKTQIWQRSFHDRLIRDRVELNSFRKYILNNPKNYAS